MQSFVSEWRDGSSTPARAYELFRRTLNVPGPYEKRFPASKVPKLRERAAALLGDDLTQVFAEICYNALQYEQVVYVGENNDRFPSTSDTTTFAIPKREWKEKITEERFDVVSAYSSIVVFGSAQLVNSIRGSYVFQLSIHEPREKTELGEFCLRRNANDVLRYLLCLDMPDLTIQVWRRILEGSPINIQFSSIRHWLNVASEERSWKVVSKLIELEPRAVSPKLLMGVVGTAKPASLANELTMKILEIDGDTVMRPAVGIDGPLTMAIMKKRSWDVLFRMVSLCDVTPWCVTIALIYHKCRQCSVSDEEGRRRGTLPFSFSPTKGCILKLLLSRNTPASCLEMAIRAQSPVAVVAILRHHPRVAASRTLRMDNGTLGTVYEAHLDGLRSQRDVSIRNRGDFILDMLIAYEDGFLSETEVPEQFRARRNELTPLFRAVIRCDVEAVQSMDRDSRATIAPVGVAYSWTECIDLPPAMAKDVALRLSDRNQDLYHDVVMALL